MSLRVVMLALLGLTLVAAEEIQEDRADNIRRWLRAFLDSEESDDSGITLEELLERKRNGIEAGLDDELEDTNEYDSSDEEEEENINNIVRDLMNGDDDDLRADLEVRMRNNKNRLEYKNFVTEFEDFVQSQLDIGTFKRQVRDELEERVTKFDCNLCRSPARMKGKTPRWWRRLLQLIPEIQTDACKRCA